jgi:hypothetical protein
LDAVRGHNECCVPALSDGEVAGIARSAWNYQQQGRNFAAGEKPMMTWPSEFESLAPLPGGSDALMLLLHLRRAHWAAPHFALSAKAMARAQTIPGWTSHNRFRNARAVLIEAGLVEVVSEGGRRRGDPALFRLAGAHAQKGPEP